MTEVTAGGTTVDVAPQEAQRAYQKGRAEFNGAVQLVKGDQAGEVDSADLPTALAQGWRVADEGQQKEATLRREEGGLVGNIQGGAEALGRGLTFGGSDLALRAFGADTERMAARKQQLGGGAAALEMTAGLLSGGIVAKGAKAAGTLALGKSALGRIATGGLAGAAEGGITGAGSAVTEAVLGGKDLAADQILAGATSGAGLGSLFGAGATTMGMGLERAYQGGQKVAGGLINKALGAGDDATSAAGRAALNGDNVISGLARKQVQMLGGGDLHIAAAERALGRTRTAAGRNMAKLAGGPAQGIDDAVGARLRSSVGNAGAGKAVGTWAKKIKASDAGRKMLAKQAGAGAESLRGVQGKGAAKVRQLLRAEGRGIADYKAYNYGRSRLSKTLQRMEDAGDPSIAQARVAAQPYLDAGTDAMVWGDAVGARGAVQSGQQAEKALLAQLKPKVRAALAGGEIDDATARALSKEPRVAELMDVRAKMADALEGAGEDVAGLRKGIDDVRNSLKYRSEIGAAGEDLQLLEGLEAGTGATVRRGLELAGQGAGAILGGLSFGGVALGKLGGVVAGAATKPASAIRTLARVRGGLDAVRARQGKAIQSFANLAEGGADVARRGGRRAAGAGRRVPPAAVKKQRAERQTKLIETIRRVGKLTDPEVLAEDMGQATKHLRAAAPDLTGALTAGAARAAAYLTSVAPPIYSPTFSGGVEMVDPFELDTYERRFKAVEDPLAALGKMSTGTLTRDEVDAIQAVYPAMYGEFQDQVMEIVGAREAAGKPVSFTAKTALGMLGGVITDDSLRPDDYAQIQASMGPPPSAAPPPPPPAPTTVTPPPLSKWQRMEANS